MAGELVAVSKELPFQAGDLVAAAAPHASLAVVNASQVYPVPHGITAETASFVQLGVIAVNAVEQSCIRRGVSVVVFGHGIIGQLLVQLAAALGASPVISVARTDRRVCAALTNSAQEILILERDGIDALRELKASIILDATGQPDAIPLALLAVRPSGTIVIVGSPREATRQTDFGELADKKVTILGAHAGRLLQPADDHSRARAAEHVKTFFRLVAEGHLDLNPMISARIHPWEADWFYRRLARPDDATVGAVFCWDLLEERERMQRVSYRTGPDLTPLSRARKVGPRLSYPASGFWRSLPSRARKFASTTASANEVLRIGLIGCGERGASYPRAIAETGNAQLAMVADVDGELARELGERLGLPWTTELEDLLDRDQIDAVLVCTPHHVHAAQVIEAARSGKHVMVEKPLATSMADAVAAVEATQASNVRLSMVLQTRYQPHVQKARELIRAGALGRLLGSSTTYQHDKLQGYWLGGYTGRSRSNWRARSETSGGGVLIHSAIHSLDWLGYLTGEAIVEVSARQATLDSPAEVEDTIAAWIRYGNDALGSLHAATCVRGSELLDEVELWGTDGQISLRAPHRFYSLRLVDGHRAGQWHEFGSLRSDVSDSTEYFRRFAACVLAGNDPEIGGEDALRLQAIVAALYESANLGKPVTVNQLL
jgi:predicted dehydrogenase/threonine dehydrogenase-like Zn-dependent dehydrogenase